MLWAIGKDILEISLVVLADILSLFKLASDLKHLLDELRLADLKLADSHLAANFQKFHDIASVPLNRLNAHVVVHAFLHKGRISEGLALFRHQHSV